MTTPGDSPAHLTRAFGPFARTPSGRFWRASGGAAAVGWGAWAAGLAVGAAGTSCSHCHAVLAANVVVGPAAGAGLAGWLLGLPTAGPAGWAVWVTGGAAFLAVLTAAGWWLPRGRCAVWAVAGAAQAGLALMLAAAVRS